jgi:hypothetical protein
VFILPIKERVIFHDHPKSDRIEKLPERLSIEPFFHFHRATTNPGEKKVIN